MMSLFSLYQTGLLLTKELPPRRAIAKSTRAIKAILIDKAFGKEVTFTILTDGTYCLPFASLQAHKMSHDGDTNKNTVGTTSDTGHQDAVEA